MLSIIAPFALEDVCVVVCVTCKRTIHQLKLKLKYSFKYFILSRIINHLVPVSHLKIIEAFVGPLGKGVKLGGSVTKRVNHLKFGNS